MLELPPDLENILREQAADSGQDVGEYIRLLLDRQPDPVAPPGSLNPDDYPREGEDWTEEEMQMELEWAMRQKLLPSQAEDRQ